MVPDRKARLLLVSSQASPPSSQVSFQKKTNRELDRFDGFPAVQDDRLAVGLDLLPAPRPQIRVPPARRIAERVSSGLADGAALGLEFLAGVEQRVPGFREGIVPNLVEPRFAIGDQRAADGPRQADPFVADS